MTRRDSLAQLVALLVFGPATIRIAQADTPAPPDEVRRIVVQGTYQPARVTVPAGKPFRLVFERREYGGCTRTVVFPSLGLERELPPNVPVAIDFAPQPAGVVEFRCGMKMIRGQVVIEAAP